MCGFTAVVNKNLNASKIEESFKFIAYRGEITGYYNYNDSHFLATRLPRSGNRKSPQPIVSECSILLFNGEIYNINYLLEKHGLPYSLNSVDSEGLLFLLEKKGVKILNELCGEFAIVFYDKKSKRTILSRDNFGTKPLFYQVIGESIIASSSSSAIAFLNDSHSIKSLNKRSITDYLYFGVSKSISIFNNVEHVRPGTVIIFDSKNIIDSKLNLKNNNKSIETQFNESVSFRFERVNSTFIAFSGGVDSSLIRFFCNRNVKCFKLHTDFEVKSKNKNLLEYNPSQEELEELIENYITYAERPITSLSGIGLSYIFSQAKKMGFENVLTGEGADEIFYGYGHYYIKSVGHPILKNKKREMEIIFSLLNLQLKPIKTSFEDILYSKNYKDWRNFDIQVRLPEHLCRMNSDLPALLNRIEPRAPFLDLFNFYSQIKIKPKIPKSYLKAILENKGIDYNKRKIGLYLPPSYLKNQWFIEKINQLERIRISDEIFNFNFNETYKSLKLFYKNFDHLSLDNKHVYKNILSKWVLGLYSLTKTCETNKSSKTKLLPSFTTVKTNQQLWGNE